MSRRLQLQQPWYRRFARYGIGAIALLGTILTAYLTYTKLTGATVGCLADAGPGVGGCNDVLNSAYGEVFGLPLPLFGCGAYLVMGIAAFVPYAVNPDKQRARRRQVEATSWWILLVGSFAMATVSSYLMYVLATELQAVCPYCIASAAFSTSLLMLTLVGGDWDDLGQVAFTGTLTILAMAIVTFGAFSGARSVAAAPTNREPIPAIASIPKPGYGWDITTTSGPAEMALAARLKEVGAIKYGAYWCPHCFEQKQLFGAQAFAQVPYIECGRDIEGGQPEACQERGVRSYPTWEIDGELYAGTQTLEQLAELAGYKGPKNFRYTLR